MALHDSGPLTPEQRSMRARAAAYAMHAMGGTNTRAATAARMAADELAVDPDLRLEPEERARRAKLHRRGRMALLALRSSRVRSAHKKAVTAVGTPVTAKSEVPHGSAVPG